MKSQEGVNPMRNLYLPPEKLVPARTWLDELPFFQSWRSVGSSYTHVLKVSKVGSYSVSERRDKIMRWILKKRSRSTSPKYVCHIRKIVANSRRRCGGRFMPMNAEERAIREARLRQKKEDAKRERIQKRKIKEDAKKERLQKKEDVKKKRLQKKEDGKEHDKGICKELSI